MQNYLRTSGTDAALGLSPFEFGNGSQELSRPRLLGWKARWVKRMLPFLFVLTLWADEAQAPVKYVPADTQIKYQKARADLATAIQEAVVFCKGDFGFTTDGKMACVPDTKEDKK